MVDEGDLPAAAGREARLAEEGPTFRASTVPALQPPAGG